MVKLINFPLDVVKLMLKDGDLEEEDVFASVTLNPDVSWAKFILTDDRENANKHRIPIEEFDNLIKTGINMPIKMAYDKIGGHEESFPIGVITNLKKVKNQVVGLAALWKKERPDDVKYIKEKYNKGEPLDLSWEVSYDKIEEDEKTGIKNLIGTSLSATTLVSEPAYGGRTGITALASKEEEVNTLEERIKELEKELKATKDELVEIKESNESLSEELKEKEEQKAEFEEQLSELEELRSFKEKIEAEREREERIQSIKEKFEEAGINKDEEYFEEKSDVLLSLDEDSLDFFIQETVAFAEEYKNSDRESEEAERQDLPNFNDLDIKDMSVEEIAEELRKRHKK